MGIQVQPVCCRRGGQIYYIDVGNGSYPRTVSPHATSYHFQIRRVSITTPATWETFLHGWQLPGYDEGDSTTCHGIAVDNENGWLYFAAVEATDGSKLLGIWRMPLDGGVPVRLCDAPTYTSGTHFYPESPMEISDDKIFGVDGETIASVLWMDAIDGDNLTIFPDAIDLSHGRTYGIDVDGNYTWGVGILGGPGPELGVIIRVKNDATDYQVLSIYSMEADETTTNFDIHRIGDYLYGTGGWSSDSRGIRRFAISDYSKTTLFKESFGDYYRTEESDVGNDLIYSASNFYVSDPGYFEYPNLELVEFNPEEETTRRITVSPDIGDPADRWFNYSLRDLKFRPL